MIEIPINPRTTLHGEITNDAVSFSIRRMGSIIRQITDKYYREASTVDDESTVEDEEGID
ncbi:hypothetical protein [Ralstonia phage RP13]|nr:hypothetical protein [Ralstonia phage RP13]